MSTAPTVIGAGDWSPNDKQDVAPLCQGWTVRTFLRIKRSSSLSLILPRRFRSSVAGAPCGPGRLAAGLFVMLAVLLRSNAMSGEHAASRAGRPVYAVPVACP